jgi:hypothetical protein
LKSDSAGRLFAGTQLSFAAFHRNRFLTEPVAVLLQRYAQRCC